MNERIKDLAKKAGAHISVSNLASNPVQYRENIELWDDRIEKFAELIVKECVDKVDKAGFNFNEQPQYNNKQNALVSEGFFWALESVKQQIREHFGVEE